MSLQGGSSVKGVCTIHSGHPKDAPTLKKNLSHQSDLVNDSPEVKRVLRWIHLTE